MANSFDLNRRLALAVAGYQRSGHSSDQLRALKARVRLGRASFEAIFGWSVACEGVQRLMDVTPKLGAVEFQAMQGEMMAIMRGRFSRSVRALVYAGNDSGGCWDLDGDGLHSLFPDWIEETVGAIDETVGVGRGAAVERRAADLALSRFFAAAHLLTDPHPDPRVRTRLETLGANAMRRL